MSQYYGSDRVPQSPFMRASVKQHTPQQINEWWDALAKGANEDLWVSRDLNKEPQSLYLLNDKGVLAPAVRSGEDLSSVDVRGRLLDQARAGRLFLRGLNDDYPRQVLADDKYDVALTKQTNTLPAVEGKLPPKPQRPFFLKFLLAFMVDSFKEDVENYNARKEKYDQAVQRREMIQNFRDNVKKPMKESIAREANDPDIAARKKTQEKALSEAWELRKAQAASAKEAAEKEWMKNPSKETLGTFENHLRDMCIKDFAGAAESVLRTKGPAGEYYKNLAQMLEQQYAIPLLEKVDECTTEAAKNALLLKNQENYIKMMKNLKAFVPSQIDGERLTKFLQTENPSFEQTNEMYQEIGKLAANGMKEYQKLNPKPETAKDGPKPEMQLNQPTVEVEPPKASGLAIGGMV